MGQAQRGPATEIYVRLFGSGHSGLNEGRAVLASLGIYGGIGLRTRWHRYTGLGPAKDECSNPISAGISVGFWALRLVRPIPLMAG